MPTKALEQLRDDDMKAGDYSLRNIGMMLRDQGWPGPSGTAPPCPMFKDMKTKYPEISARDTYEHDAAIEDLEIFKAIGFGEKKEIACVCFYFENSSALNVKNSLELYEKITKDHELSEAAFRKMLDQCCIQLGTIKRLSEMGVLSLNRAIISEIPFKAKSDGNIRYGVKADSGKHPF